MAKNISDKDRFIWQLLKDPDFKVTREGKVLTRLLPGCSKTAGTTWRSVGWVSQSRGGTKNYWRLKYKGVLLYRNRIIWAAFGENLDPKLTINHKDPFNSLNDHIDNLEQITSGQNISHARQIYRRMGMSAAEAKAGWKKGSGGATHGGGKVKWFRHHSNAHKGGAIQSLIPIFGKAHGLGLYFLLVEYCADKWDGVSAPVFKIHQQELRSFLGLKQNKLTLFLECIQNQTDFSFKQTEFFFEINFPKLLEVRHRDALNASTRQALIQHESGGEENRVEEKRIDKKEEVEGATSNSEKSVAGSEGSKPTSPATPQPKEENGIGVIEVLRENNITALVLPNIATSVQQAWVQKYELEWLKQKIYDAILHHMELEGVSTPSQINDWGKRLTGWIRREKKPSLVNPGVFEGQSTDLSKATQDELESLFPTYDPEPTKEVST